ncbi:MAG: ribosomal protein S18-alanine N-acetyltransferase [Chloroflexota bacterium]
MADPAHEIGIRQMDVADVPGVYALDVLSFSLPWTERSFYYEVTGNVNARNWVAELSHEGTTRLVGMLVMWLFLDEAHIATLAVHPDFRRRGIARKILQTALSAAYNEGACRSLLEVRAGNLAALNMYKGFGFKIVGRRNHYYHDNDEDAILMTLDSFPSFLSAQ